MRFFTTEGPVDYPHYRFSYQLWAQLEPDDPPHKAYQMGYLPFSANPDGPHRLFYQARSLRVPLHQFHLHKKRRYDHRLWLAAKLQHQLFPKDEFLRLYSPESLAQRATQWMQQRFTRPYLTQQRFHFLLQSPLLSHILAWFGPRETLAAFAFLVLSPPACHYWFCFYPAPPNQPHPKGHGFLTDFLHYARSVPSVSHAYLGTAYGLHSRYKSRGIHPAEFWDGSAWSPNRHDLLQRQQADPHPPP